MTKNTIKKYTQFITSVEKRGTRRLYHIGENFIVEAMTCEPIEMYRTASLEEAKKTHNKLVHSWNDKLYEGSTAKLLGAENCGQFVKCIKAC